MSIFQKKLFILFLFSQYCHAQNGILVFQSDFGVKDGAVSAMKGVAIGVSPRLNIFDITHEIPAYDVWEASYRLVQAAPYWPAGTVFVSVCDPGVGTQRKSVVMLSRSGHYFVTPDNGTLTHVAELLGIEEVREIDEAVNRRRNSADSYTFHGRDVYAYTGALLASRKVTMAQIGQLLPATVEKLPYTKPYFNQDSLVGSIPVLDTQYGNVWTDIDKGLFGKLGIQPGEKIEVVIRYGQTVLFKGTMPLVHTFGEVGVGEDLGYFNSLANFSIATNQEDFAATHSVKSGSGWVIILKKPN